MSAKRFRIAFSFAGEKRTFVAEMADVLAERFAEAAILYDKFHEAEFARRNLGIYLPELYHQESDLVVVVVCPDYDVKQWTGLEWTAIHDLLSRRKDDEVMLCRFDHATVTGLYSTAGFIELDQKTPAQAATLILERLALNEGKTRTFTPSLLFRLIAPPAPPPPTTSPASSPSSAARPNSPPSARPSIPTPALGARSSMARAAWARPPSPSAPPTTARPASSSASSSSP